MSLALAIALIVVAFFGGGLIFWKVRGWIEYEEFKDWWWRR